MDNLIITASTQSTPNGVLLVTTDNPIRSLQRRERSIRMLADDDYEDDFVDEDEDEDEDEEWEEEDDLGDDDDDDDWDDDDLEEDDDFDDDFEEDDEDWIEEEDEGDDYEYEYRGDPSWDDGEDFDDDYNLLGAKFSSLLDDHSSEPRRFRDRDGSPKGDKKPKKSYRQRVTNRRRGEVESDED